MVNRRISRTRLIRRLSNIQISRRTRWARHAAQPGSWPVKLHSDMNFSIWLGWRIIDHPAPALAGRLIRKPHMVRVLYILYIVSVHSRLRMRTEAPHSQKASKPEDRTPESAIPADSGCAGESRRDDAQAFGGGWPGWPGWPGCSDKTEMDATCHGLKLCVKVPSNGLYFVYIRADEIFEKRVCRSCSGHGRRRRAIPGGFTGCWVPNEMAAWAGTPHAAAVGNCFGMHAGDRLVHMYTYFVYTTVQGALVSSDDCGRTAP